MYVSINNHFLNFYLEFKNVSDKLKVPNRVNFFMLIYLSPWVDILCLKIS